MDASIIHSNKRKGNHQVRDNHRDLSLKIVYRLKDTCKSLLNRLNVYHDQTGLILENQRGFRKDRVTTDIIFTHDNFKKCQEQNAYLFCDYGTDW